MTPDGLQVNTRQHISLHMFDILETFMMARRLNCGPQQVVIIGVKAKDTRCGPELSAELTKVMPEIVRLMLSEVADHQSDFAARNVN